MYSVWFCFVERRSRSPCSSPERLFLVSLRQAANPFFKLLTMLMEFAGGPPGMPSFASYILQRIWEVTRHHTDIWSESCVSSPHTCLRSSCQVIEYNPSQCLDWLAVQTPRNKLAHSWVLQNMENWVERFLLAHNYPRVRTCRNREFLCG